MSDSKQVLVGVCAREKPSSRHRSMLARSSTTISVGRLVELGFPLVSAIQSTASVRHVYSTLSNDGTVSAE